MKMKVFLIMVIILGVLAGCVAIDAAEVQIVDTETPSSEPHASSTYTSMLIHTPTPAPTLFLPPNPTPHPTLATDNALLLFNVMQDGNCKLPCFLGIIPGETTIQDATDILLELGGSDLGGFQRETDEAFDYPYSFDIGDMFSGEKTISYSISLITNNDIVQVITVSASTYLPKSSPISLEAFRKYWQRYSARQIFIQLGEPDNLSVNWIESDSERGAELIMIYEKENIVIVIYGSKQENNLCPRNEATSLYLGMLISNPETTVDIYGDGRVPFTNQEIYPPIEEIFGVGAREFYYSVNSDPSICWEQKSNSEN